jgi:hypothetical protein
MSPLYYRLSALFAASVSLALCGCGGLIASEPPGGPAATGTQQAAAKDSGEIDTEATIWTVLGLAKKESEQEPGPQTGASVSPTLWQASHDTLDFVKIVSEDPLTGSIITDWYSPEVKPNERYRITVFILARTLRSDSIVVTVDRQERSPGEQWRDTTIDKQVDYGLVAAILTRARQIRQTRATK